jgi:hypothetical protein
MMMILLIAMASIQLTGAHSNEWLLCGGLTNTAIGVAACNEVMSYNMRTNSWTKLPPLQHARGFATAAVDPRTGLV